MNFVILSMPKFNPFYKFLTAEDLLHIAVLKYIDLAYHGALILHAPMEGKRSPFERYKAVMLGITRGKGFPDLLIIYKGKTIALELKTDKTSKTAKGTLSDEQKKWIKDLNENNIPAFAAFGFDEAQKIIDENFKPLKFDKNLA